MEWFYVENNERRGPVSDAELSELNRTGKIDTATMVWREGWSDWRKFGDAKLSGVTTEGNAACVECGKVFPTSEMIQYEDSWVCAGCKPVFFQKVKEGVPIGREMRYAGFWIRFVAIFVDGIILQIVNIPLRFLPLSAGDPDVQMRMTFLIVGISMLVSALYEIFFIGRFGATPGKMALRLQVVRPDGGKLSYGRACGRYFAKFLSSLILLIGYIMAAFDEQKRSLHDRICDTRVIRRNA